ncbi:hypothetical protein MWU65_09890 [Cellulophaga sp. F20128]|uniref:hypothetical protein n=1 Tax=Cellulophaga sp. F20128 TaxID=2926413 RepID=UPI001FF5736A|nr:hypothetical protein [Cellulophaga sp. F20128]MCK0157489.1 hypothetical protein [Cellulophaga sp. F20128]
MKIFFALLFTLALSATFTVPAIALLLDDEKVLNIGNVLEEEEKEVKLRGEVQKFISKYSYFLTYTGIKIAKSFTFSPDIAPNSIYMDVFLPPPKHTLAS